MTNTSDKKLKTVTGAYPNTVQGADIWVKKWVDYSSKYGLGYLLSNGFTGVVFNDSSKIILETKTGTFNYIERRSSDKQEIVTGHSLSDYPQTLQKKVTLLQHFKNYLEGENNSGNMNININSKMETKKTEDDIKFTEEAKKASNFIYVKKWMRTKHAIMFRLSNKIVQVCFQDHTEIILSSESRVVTYVNKKAERTTYPLNTALESNNHEMTKRLKYTKDILTHMLNTNTNPVPSGTNRREADPTVDEK
jgi:polo-like kinase 1